MVNLGYPGTERINPSRIDSTPKIHRDPGLRQPETQIMQKQLNKIYYKIKSKEKEYLPSPYLTSLTRGQQALTTRAGGQAEIENN